MIRLKRIDKTWSERQDQFIQCETVTNHGTWANVMRHIDDVRNDPTVTELLTTFIANEGIGVFPIGHLTFGFDRYYVTSDREFYTVAKLLTKRLRKRWEAGRYGSLSVDRGGIT